MKAASRSPAVLQTKLPSRPQVELEIYLSFKQLIYQRLGYMQTSVTKKSRHMH